MSYNYPVKKINMQIRVLLGSVLLSEVVAWKHVFTVSSAKHGVARATDAEPRGKQRAADERFD